MVSAAFCRRGAIPTRVEKKRSGAFIAAREAAVATVERPFMLH